MIRKGSKEETPRIPKWIYLLLILLQENKEKTQLGSDFLAFDHELKEMSYNASTRLSFSCTIRSENGERNTRL